MEKKTSNLFSNKLFTLIAIPLIITITGSAMWDFILADLLVRTYDHILALLEPIAQNYVDSVYKNASSGTSEWASYMLLASSYSFVYGYFLCVIYTFFKNHRTQTEQPQDLNIIPIEECDVVTEIVANDSTQNEPKQHRLVVVTFIILMIVGFLSLNVVIKNCLSHSIQDNTLKNIEIVSPYISDKEYKLLKSDFYLIETKADYLSLMQDLSNIAEHNNLTLKK